MTEMKMGECKLDGCYEIAEILVKDGVLERWIEEGKELPHTLSQTLAGWYMYAPRPSSEDIVGVVDLKRKGGWYSLKFKLRRGKETLARFLSQHRNASIVTMGEGVLLNCWSCEKELVVPWDSFGYLGGRLGGRTNEESGRGSQGAGPCVRVPVRTADTASEAQGEAGNSSAG